MSEMSENGLSTVCDFRLCLQIRTDSKTTTRTRFSQSRVRSHEASSFWRENAIAIVILERVLARMS